MNVAKVLRQVIPRPKVVPKFGQSTERFIIVDTSQRSFNIPDTECSFSFLLALSGSREIHLLPAEECKHQCKPLKVELKETYLCEYLFHSAIYVLLYSFTSKITSLYFFLMN